MKWVTVCQDLFRSNFGVIINYEHVANVRDYVFIFNSMLVIRFSLYFNKISAMSPDTDDPSRGLLEVYKSRP